MRNPPWIRDELILALNLYIQAGKRKLSPNDNRVIELSNLLNRLSIHTIKPDEEKFRNPNSIVLKLANFRALDPDDPRDGMTKGGKKDKEIWDEFYNHPEKLKKIADAIQEAVVNGKLSALPEEGEEEIEEGQILYRIHRTRERDKSIVNKKKLNTLKKFGKLCCAVCNFDFFSFYGNLGKNFIECHHIVPLYSTNISRTKPEDLALVCANCHRMLHRSKSCLNIAELKKIIEKKNI